MIKRVVILGGGESGVGAAILAATNGLTVFVSDAGPIKDSAKMELEHYAIDFEEHGHTHAPSTSDLGGGSGRA